MNYPLWICLTLSLVSCSDAGSGRAVLAKGADDVQWLFVQSARSGSLEGDELKLVDVTPTVFFSDRPVRIEGQMQAERLVEAWGEGKDNFAQEPPNAILSVFGDGEPSSTMVDLRNPKLEGDSLSFQVTVLEGEPLGEFGQASLFIDALGIPGATMGLGLQDAVQDSLRQPSVDGRRNGVYYRAWSPWVLDPMNPNLASGKPAYEWAYDQDGPPKLGLQHLYSN